MTTQLINRIIPIITMLLLISCSNESKSSHSKSLPNTPETVSKQWQFHLDNNEIEKVAKLSTTTTKEWLTENKELFLNDTQVYKTEFVEMTCQTEGDKATCTYIIREEGELIEDAFLLKKVAGQWLVDLEEYGGSPALEEQIFQEMERELKLDKL